MSEATIRSFEDLRQLWKDSKSQFEEVRGFL